MTNLIYLTHLIRLPLDHRDGVLRRLGSLTNFLNPHLEPLIQEGSIMVDAIHYGNSALKYASNHITVILDVNPISHEPDFSNGRYHVYQLEDLVNRTSYSNLHYITGPKPMLIQL